MAKQSKNGSLGKIILIVIVILAIIGVIFGRNNQPSDIEVSTSEDTGQREVQGVTGMEVQTSEAEKYGSIEDFRYEISGNEVLLKSYSGKAEILEIRIVYIINDIEYKTNISHFQIGIGNSKVRTLILDDGFTEVKDSIFNSCDVNKVYFPKSMTNVYDYTLAYLHPDDGQTIKIYYGGTQDEWLSIFTEYHKTDVEDAEWGAEKGKAWADKINEMVGVEYDSSSFEYFFLASPDDLKQ